MAGLGFVLPGMILVTLGAWLYFKYGLANSTVVVIFDGIKCAVSAAVLGSHRNLGNHAFLDHDTQQFSTAKAAIAMLGAVQNAIGINFFLSIAVCGVLCITLVERRWGLSGGLFAACVLVCSRGPSLDLSSGRRLRCMRRWWACLAGRAFRCPG